MPSFFFSWAAIRSLRSTPGSAGGTSWRSPSSWSRQRWEIERTRRRLSDDLARLAEDERVHFLANPAVEVSSTGLRESIEAGEPISPDDMSPLVLEYVRKYSLYT